MSEKIDDYDLGKLIDAQPVIVTVIDPRSYTALYQNESGKKKLGVIKGKTCYENIPKTDAVCPFCKMPEALETGQVQSSEVQLPDGSWLLVQFAPVARQDGTLDIVETITDVTPQKTREQEHDKMITVLVDREEKIETLRDQVRSLGKDPSA